MSVFRPQDFAELELGDIRRVSCKFAYAGECPRVRFGCQVNGDVEYTLQSFNSIACAKHTLTSMRPRQGSL